MAKEVEQAPLKSEEGQAQLFPTNTFVVLRDLSARYSLVGHTLTERVTAHEKDVANMFWRVLPAANDCVNLQCYDADGYSFLAGHSQTLRLYVSRNQGDRACLWRMVPYQGGYLVKCCDIDAETYMVKKLPDSDVCTLSEQLTIWDAYLFKDVKNLDDLNKSSPVRIVSNGFIYGDPSSKSAYMQTGPEPSPPLREVWEIRQIRTEEKYLITVLSELAGPKYLCADYNGTVHLVDDGFYRPDCHWYIRDESPGHFSIHANSGDAQWFLTNDNGHLKIVKSKVWGQWGLHHLVKLNMQA